MCCCLGAVIVFRVRFLNIMRALSNVNGSRAVPVHAWDGTENGCIESLDH